MTVWAFNKANENDPQLIYKSVKEEGKSRFGWSDEDLRESKNPGKQRFLLDIEVGDWIVHIHTPERGKCIAGKVKSSYNFDEGIEGCSLGRPDFRHYFELEKDTIIEFDRKDSNVLPNVNLKPRARYQRVYAVDDFLQSIENLKNKTIPSDDSEYALRDKNEAYLKEIASLVHEMNRSKRLEGYLAKVLRKVPGVVDVRETGAGGRDHGADLVVTMDNPVLNPYEIKIVVQVKSYEGEHYDLSAVGQVKKGIEEYAADAGLIITTAESTDQLEDEISKVSVELNKPITLLAGKDLARFIVKFAPDLLFNLGEIS